MDQDRPRESHSEPLLTTSRRLTVVDGQSSVVDTEIDVGGAMRRKGSNLADFRYDNLARDVKYNHLLNLGEVVLRVLVEDELSD